MNVDADDDVMFFNLVAEKIIVSSELCLGMEFFMVSSKDLSLDQNDGENRGVWSSELRAAYQCIKDC